MKPYYLLWQFFVLFKVFNLHRWLKFSLVHHITYNNLDVPGYLWLLPKVHFVWGPLGGGQVPDKCFKGLYKKGWPKEVAREWLKKFARYNPIVHFAVRKSSLVLFANEDTKKRLNATLMKRSYSMLETAIDSDKVVGLRKSSHKKGTLKVLWVGQVEPRKALRMVVDAIAVGLSTYERGFNIHVDVVGDGPDLEEMRCYIQEKMLNDKITLHGRVSFEKVDAFYEAADVFLFSSVQDTSGNVVLEAMAKGLPVIALNHQGVKEIIEKGGGGVLVDLGEYEEVLNSFASTLKSLMDDSTLIDKLGKEALESISKHFTWSSKAKEVKRLYDEVLH